MKDIDALFISTNEEANWLLNLRALNINEFDPIFNGFILLCKPQTDSYLFVDDVSYDLLSKNKDKLP